MKIRPSKSQIRRPLLVRGSMFKERHLLARLQLLTNCNWQHYFIITSRLSRVLISPSANINVSIIITINIRIHALKLNQMYFCLLDDI